jgi:hypothetical protein
MQRSERRANVNIVVFISANYSYKYILITFCNIKTISLDDTERNVSPVVADFITTINTEKEN